MLHCMTLIISSCQSISQTLQVVALVLIRSLLVSSSATHRGKEITLCLADSTKMARHAHKQRLVTSDESGA